MNDQPATPVEAAERHAERVETAEAALRQRARAIPDETALIDPPNREALGLGRPCALTFSEADAVADTIAARFAEAGLTPGDVVALQVPNVAETPLLVLGAWRAGLIVCPLPLPWRLDEIHQAFAHIAPRAAVAAARVNGAAPAETMCEAAAEHASVRAVFTFGGKAPDGVISIDDWFAPPAGNGGMRSGRAPGTRDPDAAAIMTWAVSPYGPYPVPRTHRELTRLGRHAAAAVGMDERDAALSAYPLTNIASVAGQLMAPVLAGARLVLHQPFDFEVFVRQLREQGVTYTAVPAPVIAALNDRLDLASGGLPLARIGCVWPSPHAPMIGPDLLGLPLPVYDIHNLGERAVLVRYREPGGDPSLLPLGGQVEDGGAEESAYLETRVRGSVSDGGDDQHTLRGTLFVRGAAVPGGPLDAAGSLAKTLLRPGAQGYLNTHIPCVVDSAVAGHFRCRKNEDWIYHGGAVVAAGELDGLYAGFPDILDAAAFSLEDPVMGERIFAAVVPRPGVSPSLARLKRYLNGRNVAPYKVPDKLVIVKLIPRNGDGQVLRGEILAQL